MRLKLKHRATTQFNMASMTDIVFLLLIFFMLNASTVSPIGLTIDLPESQHSETVAPHVQITISKNLKHYVDQVPISPKDIESALENKLKNNSDAVIYLQVDQSVPIQNILKIVDIANGLKAPISIATRPSLL